jgi:hypothetical protein
MAILASHLLNPTTILSTIHLQNNEILSQNPEVIRRVFLVGSSKHGSRIRDTWKK